MPEGRGRAGLVARGISHAFGRRRVLQQVDLELAPGEVLGLLGPNGAGKTTFFRVVAGLLRPDAGEVLLDGRPLVGSLARRVRRGLGYLPQRGALLDGLTVREQLLVPIEARGGRPEEAEPLLEEAGLHHLADAPSSALSGGERRRLEVARCLATRPRLLLLDEPFAGVDPVAVQELLARVRGLAARGIGVLLTDHAVREAMGVCDRVTVLHAGRVLAEGAPREVARDARVREVWLGAGWESGPPPLAE